jgi:hypothetical protein
MVCKSFAFPLSIDSVLHVFAIVFDGCWIHHLFHYPSHYGEPMAGEQNQQNIGDDFLE